MVRTVEKSGKVSRSTFRQNTRMHFFNWYLHPVKACSNLQHLYTAVARNKEAYENKWQVANEYADKAQQFYINDSLITAEYHSIAHGKWNHMMDQTHIGYTYWQQPPRQRMPVVRYVPKDSIVPKPNAAFPEIRVATTPRGITGHVFLEQNGFVSIDANHYTRAHSSNGIIWKVLADHGKTGSAITTLPVTSDEQKPGNNSPHLQYDVYVYDTGSVKLNLHFSPTLNFHNTDMGLQYAISIDDENPQIISINSEDHNTGAGIWSTWVSNSIIIKTTTHRLPKAGKHTIKYWMVHPGVILQKLVMDFGGMKPSYLGPPETSSTSNPKF